MKQFHDLAWRFVDHAHEAPAGERDVGAARRREPERRQQHGLAQRLRRTIRPLERQIEARRLDGGVAHGNDADLGGLQRRARSGLDARAGRERGRQLRAPREVRRLGDAIEQRLHTLARQLEPRSARHAGRRELGRDERAQQPRLGRRHERGLALELARQLFQLPPRARCIVHTRRGDTRFEQQQRAERARFQMQHGADAAGYGRRAIGPLRQSLDGVLMASVGPRRGFVANAQSRGLGGEIGRRKTCPARMVPTPVPARLGQQQDAEHVGVLAGTTSGTGAQVRGALVTPRPARHVPVPGVEHIGAHAARIRRHARQMRRRRHVAAARGALGGEPCDRLVQRVQRQTRQPFRERSESGVHLRSIGGGAVQRKYDTVCRAECGPECLRVVLTCSSRTPFPT